MSEKSLMNVGKAVRLEDLDLTGTYFDDAHLVHFGNLRKLRKLALGRGGQVLAYMPQRYRAHGPLMSDSGLPYLASLTALEKLDLSFNEIEGRNLGHLGELSSLNTLVLACNAIDDDGIKTLPVLSQLRMLELFGNPITSRGARTLARQSGLRELGIRVTAAARAVDELRLALSNCDIEAEGALDEEDPRVLRNLLRRR